MSRSFELPPSVHLDASTFVIDEHYQRPPTERLAYLRKIAAKFDPNKFGVLNVTERGGKTYIIDGAGRAYVYYVLLGKTGKVPCIQHEVMKIEGEAKLFVDLNRDRKAVNSGEMFKAEVASKDRDAVLIQKTFDSFGMTIGRASGVNNIASVASVKSILHRDGVDILARALAIKKSCWPKDVCSGGLLEGIAVFLHANPNVDEPGFRKVLTDNLPGSTEAVLKVRGGGKMPLKRYIPGWAGEHWTHEYNVRRKKFRASNDNIKRILEMAQAA